MSEMDIVSEGYKRLFGEGDIFIDTMPQSGSDRKYFRIKRKAGTMIGVFNPVQEENDAFIGFTRHFISGRLPVPEVMGYLPESNVYYLQDLGNMTFYSWLEERITSTDIDKEAEILFRKILDKLILFQTDGAEGLDTTLCYPHMSFDRQSMIWDMNYFKYMFLKLMGAPFNEGELEHDFNDLAQFLLEAGQYYFLYRDFQSANIMIIEGEPWFIDYQGGRKGAPQYDVASLLCDAKISIPAGVRGRLLDYYIDNFCKKTGEDNKRVRYYYSGFCLIRLMQALGAFGFRGLYEKKPTFTESIVPAIGLMTELIEDEASDIFPRGLKRTILEIPALRKFKDLKKTYKE
jgi:aminoglycoside/choline kinase family phosphotransferase